MNPWFDTRYCPLPTAGQVVRAHFFDANGNARTINAFYAPPFTIPTNRDTQWFAVRPVGADDTAVDTQVYVPTGWYACNDYEDIHWHIEAEVTHWTPLQPGPYDHYGPRDGLALDVYRFMIAAGCTTQGFNARQTALYIGLQCEELAEKFEAIFSGSSFTAAHLHQLSNGFKQGNYDQEVSASNRAALLDADIDLAWVTLGSAFSQGADVPGALAEVARANLDKIQPDGTVLKDENGKVRNPDGWKGPNIAPFVLAEPELKGDAQCA